MAAIEKHVNQKLSFLSSHAKDADEFMIFVVSYRGKKFLSKLVGKLHFFTE